MTRWHYHTDAGDVTIVRPMAPGWSTSMLRPLCKTKGYELYMTACIEQVTCRRCRHLIVLWSIRYGRVES